MDDVLCDFTKAFLEKTVSNKKHWPQAEVDFFRKLEPIKGAVESINQLHKLNYDVWILTAPSVCNPLCYMEKRLWIEDHFGNINLQERLIISPDKSCVGSEQDILIDDRFDSHGQIYFKGELILFLDWIGVMDYILRTRPLE